MPIQISNLLTMMSMKKKGVKIRLQINDKNKKYELLETSGKEV